MEVGLCPQYLSYCGCIYLINTGHAGFLMCGQLLLIFQKFLLDLQLCLRLLFVPVFRQIQTFINGLIFEGSALLVGHFVEDPSYEKQKFIESALLVQGMVCHQASASMAQFAQYHWFGWLYIYLIVIS